jgi:gas vesicle protein
LDDLQRQIEEQKGQMRILEARNMRLHTEKTKLNEVARQAQDVLTEGAKIERSARKNAARNAQSKGQRVVDNVKVIAEHVNEAGEPVADEDANTVARNKLFQEWRHLAGYNNQ